MQAFVGFTIATSRIKRLTALQGLQHQARLLTWSVINVEQTNALSQSSSLPAGSFGAFSLDKAISFVRPFDPKATINKGYRHAIIRYRDTSKGVSAKPAKMATIPELVFPDEYSLLPATAQAVFKGVIEDEQDAIIKQAIEQKISVIEWSTISLDACLASLTALRVSQRLTKEQIDAWVRIAMVATVTQRAEEKIANKAVGYADVALPVAFANLMNGYATQMSKLSAPVPNLGMEQATMLYNQLKLSELDDDIAKSLRNKLHAILNPVTDTTDL